MHNIAKNIKIIRKEKGWTQQQMADHLFVTRQTVSNWENGRALPDLETIEQISRKLEIDSQYLLYGKLINEKYRKLSALTITIVMTALSFLFMFTEKVSYAVLRRISQYAGYHIFESGIGYGEWILAIMMSFFLVLWMFILFFNWVIADSNAIWAKVIKGCTNLFISVVLIFSAYSMTVNCIYTYKRYKNVCVTAHQRFEMTDEAYGLYVYKYEGIEHGDVDCIAYIDNDDRRTDKFMDYLINSQALKISRVKADSKLAERFMWENNFNTLPAVIIITKGNVEVIKGYEEISNRLESKIHNYKMHNIFFY